MNAVSRFHHPFPTDRPFTSDFTSYPVSLHPGRLELFKEKGPFERNWKPTQPCVRAESGVFACPPSDGATATWLVVIASTLISQRLIMPAAADHGYHVLVSQPHASVTTFRNIDRAEECRLVGIDEQKPFLSLQVCIQVYRQRKGWHKQRSRRETEIITQINEFKLKREKRTDLSC